MRTLDQAQRVANRRNRKRAKYAPLLAYAGLVELVTAEHVLREESAFVRRMQKAHYEMLRRACALRKQVRELIPREEYSRLEQVRHMTLPQGAEYSADFWRTQLKKIQEQQKMKRGS